MSTILALTDFSDSSIHAVLAALRLAEEHNHTLLIYHNNKDNNAPVAIPITNDHSNLPDELTGHEVLHTALQAAKSRMMYMSDDLDITDSITTMIDEKEISLIVMGTQGTGKSSKLWGSTTQRVLDTQKKPVLLIRDDTFDIEIKKLIFASGFKVSDRIIFERLLSSDFVSPMTELHLVSIDTTSFFTQPTIVMLEAMKSFEEIAKKHVSHTHFYQDYSIESGIVHISDIINPDLIVMAEERHNNLIKTILGNNETLNIAKRTNYPLLIMN